MENLNDIFNLSLEDFKEAERKTSTVFKPEAKAGKENVYKAVVRFIPWHKDVSKSIMKKWSSWMTNPATNEARYVDCPSTVGKKSILQELFWKYKKSESIAEQKIAENFSRRQRFASLVQIIKDDNNPENVGKIIPWPYGIKIYNKLQAEMKPEFGKPHIPFDLFEGKPFLVHVTLVAGYNNYDNCRFLDEKLPITIDGVKMDKTPECFEKIKKFLETSPDLSVYDYQEWDSPTEQFVNDVIRNIVPSGQVIESIETANRAKNTVKPTESFDDDFVLPNVSKKENSFGDLDLNVSDSFDEELYGSL